MDRMNLKVSIITVNYNNADGLEKTINSVMHQSYANLEFIVIDGGSTDRSPAIINAYNENISYWVSEKDGGIFNAMNKGITVSTGDYLIFINSGDLLVDNNIIQEVAKSGMIEDLVYGNVIFTKGDSRKEWIPDQELSFNTFYKQSIPHQSTFIKRSLFDEVGLYSENYRMVSDWEFFMLAVCKFQCSYRHMDKFIATFDETGITSDPANYPAMAIERKSVFDTHFSRFIEDYIRFSTIEREFKKIAYFNKARHFVKRVLKNMKPGPS
jgi:glycosyltransferase involved in cell wall biosynthesis